MSSFTPGRYRLSKNELIELIARVKNNLLEEHPELTPFQGEIGSFIARAVEGRNERGIARAEGFREDELARAKYYDELNRLADQEARRCEARFRDRAKPLATNETSNDKDDDKAVNCRSVIRDFDTMPIRW